MKGVNERIRLVGVGAIALVVVLFAMLNYLEIFHANALDNNPHNTSGIISEYEQPRGAILSADGVTLAQSVPSNDQYKYQRVYPMGALFGQITGYFSLTYGRDGLESEYNSDLTEADTPITLPANLGQVKKFFTTQPTPDNVQITVLSKLQQVAATELAGRDGAVVALNPKTGAILAMYSNPSYNPNPLSSHNQSVEDNAWAALQKEPGGPLLSAAYGQRFFPGSTFKIVTAAAVYDHKPAAAGQSLPVVSGFVLPDTAGQVLHNFGGEACGGNLLELFTVSCDTGFAQLGLAVGPTGLANEASDFGWDQTPPLDLPGVAQSYFPPASSFNENLAALAKSAIGQESVQATPLTIALDAGAIADGGVIMTPHLLEKVTDSQGQTVQAYKPKPWLTATSPATAKKVTNLMLSVVNSPNGTGVAAQIPGIQVAGKTGTAQTGGPTIETWFAAFAPVPDPQIAVAVLVENQPSTDEFQGGTVAAPIARAVIQAYLQPGDETTP
ncbi:MAG TPA: penicillin-binding transpeptidase domain-containing protein [Acidimicrobiales bacterium]|nr:penicillin-binding transpeptidase domain-containing protein [Acidimicrobiales bacterium]